MSVKAIVFDYGQVISFPQAPETVEKLANLAGITRERFEPVLWALRKDYDRGIVNTREYFRTILTHFGVTADEQVIAQMVQIDMDSWKRVNPATVTLMEDVKKAGYTLGILSNIPHEFLAWARANLPVFSLPHIGVFSCEHNFIKPEAEIYRKTLAAFAVEADELVFFDDIAKNVEGAKALGIRAFEWKDTASARRELASLGVGL